MNSSDKVKKIVQTEGRTARNLVLYNVPLQPDSSGTGGSQTGNRDNYVARCAWFFIPTIKTDIMWRHVLDLLSPDKRWYPHYVFLLSTQNI